MRRWLSVVRSTRERLDSIQRVARIHDEVEERAKMHQAVLDILADGWNGFNDMVHFFRPEGYAILDDTTAAKAFKVRQVPSFRYFSKRGVLHCLDGLSKTDDLASWLDKIDAWEDAHYEEALHHAFP
jgi:hypothetical protein